MQGMEQASPPTPAEYRGETHCSLWRTPPPCKDTFRHRDSLARPDWPLGPRLWDNGKQSKWKKTVLNIHRSMWKVCLWEPDEPVVTQVDSNVSRGPDPIYIRQCLPHTYRRQPKPLKCFRHGNVASKTAVKATLLKPGRLERTSILFLEQCPRMCILHNKREHPLIYWNKSHNNTAFFLSRPFELGVKSVLSSIHWRTSFPVTQNNSIGKILAYISGCSVNICWIHEWIIIKYWMKAPWEVCIRLQNNVLGYLGAHTEMELKNSPGGAVKY